MRECKSLYGLATLTHSVASSTLPSTPLNVASYSCHEVLDMCRAFICRSISQFYWDVSYVKSAWKDCTTARPSKVFTLTLSSPIWKGVQWWTFSHPEFSLYAFSPLLEPLVIICIANIVSIDCIIISTPAPSLSQLLNLRCRSSIRRTVEVASVLIHGSRTLGSDLVFNSEDVLHPRHGCQIRPEHGLSYWICDLLEDAKHCFEQGYPWRFRKTVWGWPIHRQVGWWRCIIQFLQWVVFFDTRLL